MKMFVVTVNSWNGQCDVVSVFCVFSKEEDAKQFCKNRNDMRTSSYSSEYDWEEFDVDVYSSKDREQQ